MQNSFVRVQNELCEDCEIFRTGRALVQSQIQNCIWQSSFLRCSPKTLGGRAAQLEKCNFDANPPQLERLQLVGPCLLAA